MAEIRTLGAADVAACAIPAAAAAAAVILSLLSAALPALILAAAALVLAVAALTAGRGRLRLHKKAVEAGFVTALAACVFVVCYTVLSYVAYLAVQSF